MTTSSKKLAKQRKKGLARTSKALRGAARRGPADVVVRIEKTLRTHSLAHVLVSEFDRVPDFPEYSAMLHHVAARMMQVHGREACKANATFRNLAHELQTGELYLRGRQSHPHCTACFLREVHAIAEYRGIVDFDVVAVLVKGPCNLDASGKHTGKPAIPAWVVARTAVRHVHMLLQHDVIDQAFVAQLFQSDREDHTNLLLRAFRSRPRE